MFHFDSVLYKGPDSEPESRRDIPRRQIGELDPVVRKDLQPGRQDAHVPVEVQHLFYEQPKLAREFDAVSIRCAHKFYEQTIDLVLVHSELC